MSDSRNTDAQGSTGSEALVEALLALTELDSAVVDRCPAPDCPLCGSALPIAA